MKKILENFLNGKISIEECENLLKVNNIKEIHEIANFDSSRENRTGYPEAILANGKEYSDLFLILKTYLNKEDFSHKHNNEKLLVTKLEENVYNKLKKDLSYLIKDYNLKYHEKAKILIISNKKYEKTDLKKNSYKIGIITAGTSDIPVAEEAKIIAEEGGCEVICSYDIGIAGIHRLFPKVAEMLEENVRVIIVCAGMEGALPSVVAGLVDVPVVGVPTSIGYGIGGKGKSALYSMLQSCAPGIAVVNIDNGFGAAVFALTIVKSIE
jgi:NCAIR mutase (PurE)-related protein